MKPRILDETDSIKEQNLSEKAILTRQAILSAGFDLFNKKGIHKTSIREICEKAGVAKGTFYLYFETKEMFLLAMYKAIKIEFLFMMHVLDYENPQIENIYKLIDQLVDTMVSEIDLLRFIHTSEAMLTFSVNPVEEFLKDIAPHIRKWVHIAMHKGTIRRSVTELTITTLFIMTHDVLEKALLLNYPADIKTVSEEVKDLIKRMLE